jgi:arylformamidase
MVYRTKLIDLTHNLNAATPVYPGDAPFSVQAVPSIDDAGPHGGAPVTSIITMGTHAGTHMDAPFHFFADRMTIDQVPLDVCIGQALMIDVRDSAGDGLIDVQHLKAHEERIQQVRRVVLHTGWSSRWGRPEYFTDHPVVTLQAAEYLLECRVKLVATDCPSVDREPYPVHLTLLSKDVVIVENLTNLEAVPSDVFELTVLPLKFAGRDGSPVRAIAVVNE